MSQTRPPSPQSLFEAHWTHAPAAEQTIGAVHWLLMVHATHVLVVVLQYARPVPAQFVSERHPTHTPEPVSQ